MNTNIMNRQILNFTYVLMDNFFFFLFSAFYHYSSVTVSDIGFKIVLLLVV